MSRYRRIETDRSRFVLFDFSKICIFRTSRQRQRWVTWQMKSNRSCQISKSVDRKLRFIIVVIWLLSTEIFFIESRSTYLESLAWFHLLLTFFSENRLTKKFLLTKSLKFLAELRLTLCVCDKFYIFFFNFDDRMVSR